MPWFTATPRTLLEALDSIEPPQRQYAGDARVPILRTYKISGVGTVAVGRVASGTLKTGDSVVLLPAGITSEVRSIEIYRTPRQVGLPGDLVAFNLKGVTPGEVPRGLVAVPQRKEKYPTVTSFVALVMIVDHPATIREGYQVFICVHTRTVACTFKKLISRVDKQTGNVLEESPKTLKKGDTAHIEIQPLKPTFVEPVSKSPSLARFVMRDGHGTMGVGVIKTVNETNVVAPPKLPSKKPAAHRR